MLEDLEHQLEMYRDSERMLSIARVAAQAALEIVGKYYALSDDCHLLRMAILLHPGKKATSMSDNDWPDGDINKARRLTPKEFNSRHPADATESSSTTSKSSAPLDPEDLNFFANISRSRKSVVASSAFPVDSLKYFWSQPPVDKDLWKYLEGQRSIQP